MLSAFALACSGAQHAPPDSGSDGGADGGACTCFTRGKWFVDNLSPCFASDSNGVLLAVLSTQTSGGLAVCPADLSVKPTAPWSTDTLTTNCAGHFRLCLAIKAGDPKGPKASDCVVAQPCAEGDFSTPNVKQTWTPLEGWIASDAGVACAKDLRDNGGYGEMSVSGAANGCASFSKVLGHYTYCPSACAQGLDAGNCMGCVAGGTGNF